MKTIGQRINGVIEDGDKKRTDLAKYLKVNRREIYRWENDQSEMGIQKLKEFCECYKVSADYILGLQEGLNWPKKEERRDDPRNT